MIDFILQAWTSSLKELSGALWKLGAGNSWRPGEKLSLLLRVNGSANPASECALRKCRLSFLRARQGKFPRAKFPERAGKFLSANWSRLAG